VLNGILIAKLIVNIIVRHECGSCNAEYRSLTVRRLQPPIQTAIVMRLNKRKKLHPNPKEGARAE
jgi:hypothetical protein